MKRRPYVGDRSSLWKLLHGPLAVHLIAELAAQPRETPELASALPFQQGKREQHGARAGLLPRRCRRAVRSYSVAMRLRSVRLAIGRLRKAGIVVRLADGRWALALASAAANQPAIDSPNPHPPENEPKEGTT
jgi:hypothetical protein